MPIDLLAKSAPRDLLSVEPKAPRDLLAPPDKKIQPISLENIRKQLGEIARPSFGPMVSEAISPTPVGQKGLEALGKPFEYGISRPIATGLSKIPIFKGEYKPPEIEEKGVKGFLKKATATTFEDLYKGAGYTPEVSKILGQMGDIASQIAVMHFGSQAVSPLYRSTLGVKEYATDFAKGAVDYVANKVATGVEIRQLKVDFIKQFSPKVGTKTASKLANELLSIIKENQPTTGIKTEFAMKQQFPAVERPAIVAEAPIPGLPKGIIPTKPALPQPILPETVKPPLIAPKVSLPIPTPLKPGIPPAIAPEKETFTPKQKSATYAHLRADLEDPDFEMQFVDKQIESGTSAKEIVNRLVGKYEIDTVSAEFLHRYIKSRQEGTVKSMDEFIAIAPEAVKPPVVAPIPTTDEIEIMRRQKREELERPTETLNQRIIRKEKEITELKQFNKEAEDIDDVLTSQSEIDRLTREVTEDKSTFEMMKEKYGVAKEGEEIQKLVDRYNEGDKEIATVEDVVDSVEDIISERFKNAEDTDADFKLQKAIDKFRKEQEYDYKLKGRGDIETAREKIMSAIEKYTAKPAPKEGGGKIPEIDIDKYDYFYKGVKLYNIKKMNWSYTGKVLQANYIGKPTEGSPNAEKLGEFQLKDLEIKPRAGEGEITKPSLIMPKVIPAKKSLSILPRKEQLLKQIDEAIVKAPEEAKGPFITFETDGGANIVNSKGALQSFRAMIKKQPAEMPLEAPVKKGIRKFPGVSIAEPGEILAGGKVGAPLKEPPTGREGFIKADMLNPTKWDGIRQFIEDDWIKVKRLVQQKGANVTETNNPYEAEIRYWGRIGARTEEADRVIFDIDKDIVSTSKKLNIPDKVFNKEIDQFLISRHAPERNAQHGENAAGMTDKEAARIQSELLSKPYVQEIERITNNIQDLNNRTLDTLLEGEVISKEFYDKLRAMYKNHVPLNRVMNEGDDIVEVLTRRGFDVQGAGLKRAKGSELKVADVLTNVVANYKAALSRAEKNIIDNHTLRFARENDYFNGLFEEVKLPMLPVGKVQHRAAVDSGYLQQVKVFAEKLGAKVITGGQPGRVLGTYGGRTVERKFATPEEVVSHEVGHFLDEKYKLKQQFYKRGDTKKAGEEIYQFMVDQGQSANRVKKVSERFAHAFEWWLSNRALAKEDLPLFTKAIEDIIAKIPELSPLLKIRPTPGLTVESIEQMVFARQKYNTDPMVLPVMEKGKQVYLKINDSQLAMALRGVNRQKIDGLMKGVKAFTRFYSGLMTRFNPEFVISNKVRDLQEVAVYLASKKEVGFKGAVEAIVKDPISLKDVTDSIRGKNTEGARLYKQMKMDGGTTGGMGLSTKEQLEININRIRAINRSSPRKAAEIVLRSIDQWNTIFEDSSRLSVYRQALKQGTSRNRAAVLAKEASVNFNKMGTGSPVVNALYMFSNASVQGTVKMFRAMRNPKVLATVLTLLGGAVYIVNEYNDKKDKDWRKKVSKWDRLNGINIVISTDKGIKYVTIPISWGLKPIKVFFDELGDLASGHQTSVSEAVSGLLSASIESYNPAGGTDFVSAITPSILDLPVDIARNRSWTGGKIRPDWNNSAPSSIKYFDSLRKEAIGRGFIKATKEWGEDGLEISPADVDYAFKQLIGGTGRFATKTLNTIVGTSEGKTQVKEIPFVSRFYRDIPEEQIREFGNDYKEVRKQLMQQDKDRFYFNQSAELVYAGLKDLPGKEANYNLKSIYQSDRKLYDKIVDLKKDEDLKRSYTDRLIYQLGVNNGERAKFIWKKVNELKTPREKNRYLKNLYDKKILTDRVYRQLNELKSR